VTNCEFAKFVAATGHVTVAEIVPDASDYPGAWPEMLYAGSLVFRKATSISDLGEWSQWWSFMRGADWKHPYGQGSSIDGLENRPVVHMAFADAQAYAA
jgi:sulfatase modifying factor 1